MGEAFFVMYKNLHVFSVGSYISIDWKWDKKYIQPLSKALHRKIIEVNRRQSFLENLQLATIHFDGSIEPRNLNGKNTFKGKLFYAHSGDVVYSKIDVRNGAIGIIPSGMPEVAVSSEYPVYSVDAEIANPNYIHLVFRTPIFQRILNSMISGASGRKRVQPGQIEEVEIPFPPLDVQHAIVARWQAGQKSAQEAEEHAAQILSEAEEQALSELGLESPELTEKPKFFTGYFQDFERWSIGYHQAKLSSTTIEDGKYPIVQIGSILSMVQYGTSEKANAERNGIAVIRMNNIIDGILNLSNLKHIPLNTQEFQRLLLHDGDILFNRTNSKELVGKCAVFHEKGEYVFASYLIRIRTEPTKASPDYVSFIINSYIGRQQIDAISRQIIGQANINTEELRSLRIPLPPLNVQQSIIESVKLKRVEVTLQNEKARQIRQEAGSEVEAIILGTKRV